MREREKRTVRSHCRFLAMHISDDVAITLIDEELSPIFLNKLMTHFSKDDS